MLLTLRRIGRKVRNFFVDIWLAVLGVWMSINYWLKINAAGIDERWIRQAFSYLVDLDLSEYSVVDGYKGQGRLLLRAWGNEVAIRQEYLDQDGVVWKRLYEITLSEMNGRMYAHEWRDQQREITMEYNCKVKTNWWEFLRTGRHVEAKPTVKMIYFLRMLYGEGPDIETT